MAPVLEAFVETERACVYLSEARAKQDVRVMIDVTPEEYEEMLVRGYRRFGPVYFRPACEGCSECVSIRIPTLAFEPSKAQRRAAKACRGLRIEDVLKEEDHNTVANAAVRMFQEVTDANLNAFHFHGDLGDYPVSAAIVVPPDGKTEALMAGDYARSKTAQLIRPRDDMEGLLTQLVRLEGFAAAMLLTTAGAALFVSALVFALSFRLRKREFTTLEDIGVSRISLLSVKTLEIGLIALLALVIASALYALAIWAAPAVMRLAV